MRLPDRIKHLKIQLAELEAQLEARNLFKVAAKSTEIRLNWTQAELHCRLMGAGWRLPTIFEMALIYNSETDDDFEKDYYWTDKKPMSDDNSYANNMAKNLIGDKHKNSECYVRAVRSL